MRSAAKRPWHPARLAAKERGELHYSIGKKCPHGHDKRSVKSGLCAPCGVANTRRWDALNKERNAATARTRRAKDPASHRKASLKWAKNNPEKARVIKDRCISKNIELWRRRYIAYVHNRKNRVAANGGSFTAADIEALFQKQGGKCAGCQQKRKLEVDHIKAIANGGRNDASNLQLLCRSCNASKGTKDAIEWARSKGELL
jgi:5-methylcytosine-specific restriction endonuclease McrA